MGSDGMKETQEIAMKPITADSTWEKAQTMKHTKERLGDRVEVTIPGVLSLWKEGDDYLIYVTIDGKTSRLSNVEGVGNVSCELIERVNNREEHTGVPEQSPDDQSGQTPTGRQAEGTF